MDDDAKKLRRALSCRWYTMFRAYRNGTEMHKDWLLKDNFIGYALEMGYSCGSYFERVNINKGFTPDNCVIRTRDEHYKYSKGCRADKQLLRSMYKGKYLTISEISRLSGIQYPTLIYRLSKGYFNEKLISNKYKPKRQIIHNGKNMSLREAAKLIGICKESLRGRMLRGYSGDLLFLPRGQLPIHPNTIMAKNYFKTLNKYDIAKALQKKSSSK